MRVLTTIFAVQWTLTAAATAAAVPPATNLTLFGNSFGFAQSCSSEKNDSYACYERSTDIWWLRALCFWPDGSTQCSRLNLNA